MSRSNEPFLINFRFKTASGMYPGCTSVPLNHENLQGQLEKIYEEAMCRAEERGDKITCVLGLNQYKESGGPPVIMSANKMHEMFGKYKINDDFITVDTLNAQFT